MEFFVSENYSNSFILLKRYYERINIKNVEVYYDENDISKDIEILICSIDNFKKLNIKNLKNIRIILFRKNFLENIDIYDKDIKLLTLPLSIKKFYNYILNKIESNNIIEVKQVNKLVAVIDDN